MEGTDLANASEVQTRTPSSSSKEMALSCLWFHFPSSRGKEAQTPNIGGTDRDYLKNHRFAIRDAIDTLLLKMRESWPHGRDYKNRDARFCV